MLFLFNFRFSFSSIEQQYVAESLQTMSRQHAAKSSSKVCTSTTCLGKRRIKGKCGQSSGSHRRTSVECASFGVDIDGKPTESTSMEGSELDDGPKIENSATYRRICGIEKRVRVDFKKKEKLSQRTAGVDVQELCANEGPPMLRRQPLSLWYELLP